MLRKQRTMGVCGGGVRGTLDTHSHLSKIHIEGDARMQSNDCRTTGRLVSPVQRTICFHLMYPKIGLVILAVT